MMNKDSKKNTAEYPSQVTGSTIARLSFWKKLRLWLGNYRWPLIGFVWVVAIALGFVGFSKYFSAIGETHSPSDIFYRTMQLFVLESGSVAGPIGWELQIARFLAPAIAIYTAILALATILREQIKLLRVRFLKGHVVICGLGRKGLLLAERFRERGEHVVVIEEDEDNGLLGQCREQGAIVLIGNATNPGLLRKARVDKAKYVISVCGDDGANAEVAVHARELVWNRKGKALSCLVHIVDLQLCNLLREREIMMGKPDAFRLEFFNVFESGAKVLLDEYPPFSKAPENYVSRPHMVVVGVGRMGESLVVNAARGWWDRGSAGRKPIRITLIDKEVERKKESICFRYPQLKRKGICKLVAVQMDIPSPEFERADFLFDKGNCDVTMIYICLDDDSRALGAALMLYQRVRDLEVPIVVRMTHDAGLATLLQWEKDEHGGFSSLHAFGLLDRTCTPDLIFGCTYEILARAVHEDYIQIAKARGFTPETNPSMVPWEELPRVLRESNRSWAEHIPVKLQAVGCAVVITTDWDAILFEFSPEEVELLAKMEHERFVEERSSTGWKPGPTKDVGGKTHPALVSWDQLSEEYKARTRNLIRGMPSFLARARFQIYRLKVMLETDKELFEKLAEANHEVFCDSLRAKGYEYRPKTSERKKQHSSLQAYSELPKDEKEQNRNRVRDIPNKLSIVGYAIIPTRGDEPQREFTDKEVEKLAEMEHERWMQEKLDKGWRYAKRTVKASKQHKDLVPWGELPFDEQAKDRVLVRSIPRILAKAGYTMIKTSRHSK